MKFKVHYQNIGIESNDVLSLFEKKKTALDPNQKKNLKTHTENIRRKNLRCSSQM